MNVSEEQYAEMLRRVEANRESAYETTSMVPMQLFKTEKPKRRKVTSESEIERDCTQILIHDGWRPLKTDPVSDRRRGKGFGELGMADYLYIRYGAPGFSDNQQYAMAHASAQVLWCEFKREDGSAKPHQLKWHQRERQRGALTLIAGVDFEASVEGFMDFYNRSGLKRRTESSAL